jgi:hypothetical protein
MDLISNEKIEHENHSGQNHMVGQRRYQRWDPKLSDPGVL